MSTAAYQKKIKISTDNVTFYDVPADSPTLNVAATLQENTDLSNTVGFKSRVQGLKDFNLSAGGNFKPDLTYQFNIKRGGTPTAFSGEVFSNTVGDTWKIDDISKDVWDRTVTPDFFDNAVPVLDADILSIDYLTGEVTFTATKVGPITADGTFIPTTVGDCVNTATLDFSIELEEDTNVKTVDDGWKTRQSKLKDVSISLSAFNDLTKSLFNSIVANETILVEITLGNTDQQVIRGWFLIESDNETGSVGDLETEDFTLQLDGSLNSSFSWAYPVSGFNTALKILTDHYFNGGDLFVQSIPENIIANGKQGAVLMESLSLSLDLNGKMTFSTTLQGNGALVDAT